MANKRILSKNVFSFSSSARPHFFPALACGAALTNPPVPGLVLRVMAKFGWVHDNTGSRDVFPISIPPNWGQGHGNVLH